MGKKQRIVGAWLKVLVLGLLAGGAWQWAGPVVAQEKAPDKESSQAKSQGRIHDLKKEKVVLLREVTSILRSAYMSGSTSLDRVQAAQKAQLAAELELCETDKERFAILKEVVGIARDAEAAADKRYKSGDVPKNEFLTATIARLDAEIALEKVRASLEKNDKK